MKVRYDEGLASHTALESCAFHREVPAEAETVEPRRETKGNTVEAHKPRSRRSLPATECTDAARSRQLLKIARYEQY